MPGQRERHLTVAVPAARVFAVLADPTSHSAIDGTGWVQEAVDRAPLTEVGQVFRMDMYHPNHPDGGYQVANKVQVFDPPRAIGWLTGQEKETVSGVRRLDLALRRRRAVVRDQVTLTYDWSAVPQDIREYLQFPPFGPDISQLLEQLSGLAAPATRA